VLVAGGVNSSGGQPEGIAFDGLQRVGADGSLKGPLGLLGGGERAYHSATVLADGRVVYLGGCQLFVRGACMTPLDSASIWNPLTGLFTDGPPLLHPRWDHDAILRGDGSILLVGGQPRQPLELYDPDEPRGQEAGAGDGRAVILPTGGVVIAGGTEASLWQSVGEGQEALAALPVAVAGHTLTALEDGSALLGGGGLSALALYDGSGQLDTLGPFARAGHSATLLADGSVLFAGGIPGTTPGVTPNRDAFVYLRSPLGPYSTPPFLTFETTAGLVMRRPDRVAVAGGRLSVTAPALGEGGRPGELALIAAAQFADFEVELDLGRQDAAGAALLFGWRSEAEFAWVEVEPGRPVALFTVAPGESGQSPVSADPGCVGNAAADVDLPGFGLNRLKLTFRGGVLSVGPFLSCIPSERLGRGLVGLGAMHGTVLYDNIALSR
jgi:hypothetical protein